jgi:Flp pilus assembly protein TadG
MRRGSSPTTIVGHRSWLPAGLRTRIPFLRLRKSRPAAGGGDRRGVTAVETAIVAPFLMLLLIGFMQFGWMFLVRHAMLHCCRDSARAMAVQGATAAQAQARAQALLTDFFGASYAGSFTVSATQQANDVRVTVTIPTSTAWVSFGDVFGLTSGQTMTATVAFRDEDSY